MWWSACVGAAPGEFMCKILHWWQDCRLCWFFCGRRINLHDVAPHGDTRLG